MQPNDNNHLEKKTRIESKSGSVFEPALRPALPEASQAQKRAEAQAAYILRLERKIKQIEEDWQALSQQWDVTVLKELHTKLSQLYHTSSPQKGFNQFSQEVGQLERFLFTLFEQGNLPPTKIQYQNVWEVLARLRNILQMLSASSPLVDTFPRSSTGVSTASNQIETSLPASLIRPGPTSYSTKNAVSPNILDNSIRPVSLPGPRNQRLILLLDRAGSSELAQQLAQVGYQVKTFQRWDDLKDWLWQPGHALPAALICDLALYQEGHQPDAPLWSAQMATPTLQGSAHLPSGEIPLIFISEQNTIAARLEAVKAGGATFFSWPVAFEEVVNQLDVLLTPPLAATYRILIVDDSPTAVAFYATTLEAAGMVTAVVTNPLEITQTMIEFNPELILMDMYMPGCSGLELAQVIRQQPSFVGIPIVFLSAETNLAQQLIALQMGGDDFLTKPIEASHLIALVTARASRFRILRAFIERDSLTGLFNHQRFKEQLEVEMARVTRQGAPLVMAILDLDHFKRVNDTYGHLSGDRVLRSLSRLLQQGLRRTDVIGRYGGEEFAVILTNTTGDKALEIMDRLRLEFASLPHWSGGLKFNCTFSCGLAEYAGATEASGEAYFRKDEQSKEALAGRQTAPDDPPEVPRSNSQAQNLIEAADQALYKAKHEGRNRQILSEEKL
jgi:diguanylate cyclase (GGDEF)-like protein